MRHNDVHILALAARNELLFLNLMQAIESGRDKPPPVRRPGDAAAASIDSVQALGDFLLFAEQEH